MGLGERLRLWLQSFTWWQTLKRKDEEYRKRNAEMLPQLGLIIGRSLEQGDWKSFLMGCVLWCMYIFAGGALWLPSNIKKFQDSTLGELEEFQKDPQKYMQGRLNSFATSAGTKAFTEFVGTIITEPVVGLLETYAADPNPDPHKMARAFHGIASGLPWAAESFDGVLKSLLGERAPSVGKQIMALYWGLGMGFLGWQTLAPLLSAGLQPNLERYYNKLYRHARFNAGQMRDLLALGKVTGGQFQTTLREEGWRDQDIALWQALAYRDLSDGAIWDLFHKGLITQGEAEKRLRALGYNPADIPLLFKVNEKEDTADAPKMLISTAKKAFKEKRIAVDEFRSILKTLNYADREIELQIQILSAEKEEEDRELTTGQIRELYENRVIGKDEAKHNLVTLRYRDDVANQLIRAWDEEALPKAARLNKSTITEGFSNGAISRGEAKQFLMQECGYTDRNAELILKIEEASIRKAEEETGTEGSAVSINLLTQFAQQNLITRGEMSQRAELARFEPKDRTRIIELMYQAPVQEQTLLGPDALLEAFRRGLITQAVLNTRLLALGISQEDVTLLISLNQSDLQPSLLTSAYVAGVISRADFASRLKGTGLDDEEIEIMVKTIEAENPEVFGEFTAAFLKKPSVGSLQLALQREMINEQQFRDRVSQLGYTQDAVEIMLFNAQYQAPAKPKTLSKTDILSLYKDQIFSRSVALQRLIQIGYNIDDAQLLIEQKEPPIENTQPAIDYLSGFLDQFGAASAFTDLGYSPNEIDDFFLAVEQEFS